MKFRTWPRPGQWPWKVSERLMGACITNLRFPGQYYDAESGLNDNVLSASSQRPSGSCKSISGMEGGLGFTPTPFQPAGHRRTRALTRCARPADRPSTPPEDA